LLGTLLTITEATVTIHIVIPGPLAAGGLARTAATTHD
jgi:hypothetical protein